MHSLRHLSRCFGRGIGMAVILQQLPLAGCDGSATQAKADQAAPPTNAATKDAPAPSAPSEGAPAKDAENAPLKIERFGLAVDAPEGAKVVDGFTERDLAIETPDDILASILLLGPRDPTTFEAAKADLAKHTQSQEVVSFEIPDGFGYTYMEDKPPMGRWYQGTVNKQLGGTFYACTVSGESAAVRDARLEVCRSLRQA